MLFNSPLYIFVFLPTTIIIFWFLKQRRSTDLSLLWLLIASLFFYSFQTPFNLLILATSILTNFLLAKHGLTSKASKAPKAQSYQKIYLILGIGFNLCLLGYFKYFIFFSNTPSLDFSTDYKNPVLPLAISFFTFQQIAYLVDTYKSNRSEKNFLNYCLFVSFFPQLIAGPIVHHSFIIPQFRGNDERSPNTLIFLTGISVFFFGLFKKLVIADSIGKYVDIGYNNIDLINFLDAWLVTLGFTLQIYYDFSGYTDMAYGAALLFGINLPPNFRSPYKAISIRSFWKRWHITLSTWFTDYVYIPLGGNRRNNHRIYFNILLTLLLSGLWHGAGWNFIAWGFLHGIAISANRAWTKTKLHLPKPIAWFLTFLFLNVSWIFFRGDNMNQCLKMASLLFLEPSFHLSDQFFAQLSSIKEYSIFNPSMTSRNTSFIPIEFPILLGLLLIPFKNSIQISKEIIPSIEKGKHAIYSIPSGLAIGIGLFYLLKSKGSEFIYFNF